jgi:formate hydrogenlyase subunit 6/NADH:ubiquinone oxidoreductase subunit I
VANGITALVKGFWTTLKHVARPPVTLSYPEQKKPVAAGALHRWWAVRRCMPFASDPGRAGGE